VAERPEEVSEDADRPPEYSDDAIAQRFAERRGTDLRYVAARRRWLQWHEPGGLWAEDTTLHVYDLVRRHNRWEGSTILPVMLGDKAQNQRERILAAVCSAKCVSAVETLARSDRRFAATVDQWDADPWVINTPAGLVDLRSGELLGRSRTAYATRTTACEIGDECPRWEAFLEEAMGGDLELVDYLQRVAGYALTGSTREHALVFLYGTGANGKSTFLNTLRGVFGTYATVAPADTFMEARGERHPTELAGLQGARLVVAQEIDDGQRWATARMKSLTSGDPVAARYMRGDFFEYTPGFKIILAGNHRPGLRTVDEAIRRRMHLVPFTQTVPPAKRDPRLFEKLREEWPGILGWALTGCIDWQAGGLRPPQRVRDATDAYLEDQDALGQWIGECCVIAADEQESSTDLHKSFQRWAGRNGERYLGIRRFSQAMEERGQERGFARFRDAKFRGFRGVGLTIAEVVANKGAPKEGEPAGAVETPEPAL
jgi:P4 family phage/plasmid primase-like protien